MSYKLWTYPGNARAAKALIAAQYSGVNIEVAPVEMGVTNKTPEFLAMNPNGKVPTLQTPQGAIFESNAIARYVARLRADADLMGSTFFESSQIDQWTFWANNELEAPIGVLVYPILGYLQYNKKAAEAAKADLLAGLSTLNQHLQLKTFMVGERITLADIVLTCTLSYAFKLILDPATRAQYQNVTRWFLTCVNQPEFATVLGEVKLAEQEAKPQGADAGKKEEKKKEAKKEQPKKEEKKKEEKPKKKDDDEEEEEKPKEEKPRLSPEEAAWLVQKSPMDLDGVKRLFSNNKFEDCVEQFVKEFDHNVFSIFECNYNYNEENTVEWLTANLLGGFIQRLEESRKIAYGTLTMAGNKPFYVQGLFIFKYHDVPTYVKECPDYESYTFKKIDFKSEEGQKRFAEFWVGQTIDGRELKERRFFK